MIFAKVDVTLPRHHRFLRIPQALRAAAMGVWLAALCYSRGQELDGFCPLEELEPFATKGIVDWLVRVELFAREEQDGAHGVRVLKYADHNETKAQIDARRQKDRFRKNKPRSIASPVGIQEESAGTPLGFQTESERNPNGIQLDSRKIPPSPVAGIPGSDSDSLSGSDLSLPESSLKTPTADPDKSDGEPRPSVAPTPRLIDPKLELDPESRESAAMMGIQEIDVQWKRFVEKSRAKGELSCDFRALFRSRLSFIRNDERREREKSAANGPRRGQDGPSGADDPYNSPEAVRDRARELDRKYAELKANAVPAPADFKAHIAAMQPGSFKAKPPASGTIELPRELTDEERETERQRQLRALQELETPKAEGGGT